MTPATTVSGNVRDGRPVTVALVGSPKTLKTLAEALRHPSVTVVAQAAVPEDLWEELSGSPDVLILAAGPEGRDRWPAVTAACERSSAAVVCVVEKADWRSVRAAIHHGAGAVVLLDEVDTALAAAVVAVATGQIVLPSALAAHIGRPVLSPREKQVLGMVVLGLRNVEIADALFISETTVKSHLAAAFSKLGVRSRSEASALILDPEQGLGVGILEISGDGADARSPAVRGLG